VSDLSLGRLGYGAANLGNLFKELTDDECTAILDSAWESGVRYFDTAPHYGLGLSERRLGAFLATKPRDEFIISTKVGRLLRPNPDGIGTLDLENDFYVPADLKRVWAPSAEGITASLEQSLDRLGLDRVDILYLHDPESYDLGQGIDEAIPALVNLRDAGVVGAIGVGSMSTPALAEVAATGALDLLMVAGRYTLADQAGIPELREVCAANSVSIVIASVFNSGLLATNSPVATDRYDYRGVPDDVLARVRAIKQICDEFAIELPAAALQFPLRDPLVRNVVVGASNGKQMVANAGRMAMAIPAEFWDRLETEGLIDE
jgi:D-threo-aldose 1-dehydrogenase